MKVYEGSNGQVELHDDRLVITRRGLGAFITQGLKGGKTIPFASIAAVQLKEGGILTGYIQFTLKGGLEGRGGIIEANYDENTVTFYGKSNRAFTELRDAVQQRIAAASAPATAGLAGSSVAEQLEKAARLKEQGLLSEEEFIRLKSKLLG